MNIAILSAHKSYDYRIYRHIKMLLSIGCKVDYYNITNEKQPLLKIQDMNFRYIPLGLKKKLSLKTPLVYLKLFVNFLRSDYNFIFIQDEELLSIFLLLKKHKQIVIDSHETLSSPENKSKLQMLKIYYSKVKGKVCLTPLTDNIPILKTFFENVYLIENVPLLSDFEGDYSEKFKTKKRVVTYLGMITESNRQFLKMLDVFEYLLKNCDQCFVRIAGPYSNSSPKLEQIKQKMSYLEKTFPNRFIYLGSVERSKATDLLKDSHVLLTLYLIPNNNLLSPNKIYEALASRTVVATDHINFCPSIPENVFLKVAKDDGAQEISEKILRLFSDENKLQQMAFSGYDFLVRNSLFHESYRNNYEHIFKQNTK